VSSTSSVAQSVVAAELDPPAECMPRCFAAQPVVRAVVVATFDAR
jgi:hypothetical protein